MKIPTTLPEDQQILLAINDQHDIHHICERGYVEAPVRVKALLKGVGKAGITTTSSPFWARYNSPFSLPILRRNEVLVTVDAAAAE